MLNRSIVYLCFVLLGVGCVGINKKDKLEYAKGYREGVKEHVKELASLTQDNQLPYYHWVAPIVQEVAVPGHIANGVFIPQHTELVIIKPGEWSQSPSYPIQRKGENNEETINRNDGAVHDITGLPKSQGLSRSLK